MKVRTIHYIWLLGGLLLSSPSLDAQSLQVGIVSNDQNDRFCEGVPEDFILTANPSGGKEPYTYMWIRSWENDTLYSRTVIVQPPSSGEVKLTVTDNSHPAKSKDAIFKIKEISVSADFTFAPDNSCAQTPIQFLPTASGGTPDYSYQWNFGDGDVSNEKNPIHEYISPGCSGFSDFSAQLWVNDRDWCFAYVEKTVRVKNKPFLDFIDEINPLEPFKHCHPVGDPPAFDVEVHNRSQNTSCISSYDIDWGDGLVETGVSFPIRHTYDRVGAFELKITATNSSGCDLVWTKIVYNQSSPAAGLESYGGTEGCGPIEFSFGLVGYENNSIGTTYTWDFGDESPPIQWGDEEPFENDTISHLYNRTSCTWDGPGYFTTVVTVNNGCGEIEAKVTGVRVWGKPGADIRGGIDSICTNETIQLANNTTRGSYGADCSTNAIYNWNFGNGRTSTLEWMPLMSWDEPGFYGVELTATNLCGTTTDTYPIVVLAPPIADIVFVDTAGCAPFVPDFENVSTGEGLEYIWEITPDTGYSFLNGTNENSHEPELSFNQSDTFRVVLYVQNVCDQTDSVVTNIHVYTSPEGKIKDLTNVCITNPVIHPSVTYNAHGSPVTGFSWTFTGGVPASASGEDPGVHSYSAPGEYTVGLNLENECGSFAIADTFFVHSAPEVNVNTPVTICELNSLAVTGTTISNEKSFVWQTLGDGYFDNDTVENPMYYPGAGDYVNLGSALRIIALGESPCLSDTALLYFGIQQLPSVQVDEDVVICEGNIYGISNAIAFNEDGLFWTTSGDGSFSNPNLLRPTYNPGPGDLTLGQVELVLTAQAIAPCLSDATDTLVITYSRIPTISAGPDQDICEDGQIALNATGTGFTSVYWKMEVGEGNFSDPASIAPLFTLDPGYAGNRIVLTIEATGGFGCDPVFDTIELSVIPHPVVFAGVDANVCESGTYEVTDASLQEYSDYYWMVNGDGSLSDTSLLNPVYSPGPSDIASGMVALTLFAEGNSVCANVSDEIIINIQPLPQSFAGDDQDVCKVNNYITTGSQINGASIQWNSLGTGSFEDQTELITTYYPSDIDKDHGSVELVLQVNASAPCSTPDYDTVTLTFIDPPEVFAGNDTTICSSSFVPGNASVLNATQYVWSSDGNGPLQNPATLTPTYQVLESDIINGYVALSLTSTNPACPAVSDTMVLSLTPYPISEAGSDDLICEDDVKSLDDAYSANYTVLAWRTTGDGFFDDSTILNSVYTPGNLDIYNGSVKLYLIATGIPPCNTPEMDSVIISIQRNPIVYAGSDTIIGEGEVFVTSEAEALNVVQVSWSTLGDGFFINRFNTLSTYIPGEDDLINRGVYLVLNGTSISPCAMVSLDTVFLMITPIPKANAGEDINICVGSDVTISTASAEEYSEIFWTSKGSGLLENDSTLTPTYHPSVEDIGMRNVVLTLHARGKDPIENVVVSDSMEVQIIHNAFTDVIPSDTACVNLEYQINDVIYQDVNAITWSSSGEGYFNGTREVNPIFSFSSSDIDQDSIYFYLEVNSMLPCVHVERDTLLIRLYHEPEPLFDYDNPEGCAPLSVSFSNSSAGEELSYYWDLGNGLESYLEEPGTIVYQQGRIADTTYTVVLEATNRCNSVYLSRDILVKPIPITDFGMDVAWGCSPKEIQFFNVTTGLADTYLWKWGDGSDQSEEDPGSHIFVTGDSDTTYTISLIAENECGSDSLEKSVIIFPSTVDAFFETDTSFGCAPFEVSFTNYSRGVLGDEPFLNWSWNFGDGNSITETLNPVHVFEDPGIYTVTLYVNDTCSHDFFTTEIHVLESPQAEFITDKTEYCEHDTVFVTPVNMSIDEIASVTWDFGDLSEGYDFNGQHVYDTSGVFTIALTADNINSGCAARTSREITIYKAPVADFSIPVNDGCQALQITLLNETVGGDFYAWDFGNGNRSIDLNGEQLFMEAGTYDITLKALDVAGCSDSISHRLVVNPKPTSSFESSSLQTCYPPLEVEFRNLSEGADDYLWDFGNGRSSKGTSPVITFENYGDFTVKLIATNIFSCKDTSEMVFHSYHNPVADFIVDTTIGCDPFMVQFNNLSDYGLEYFWNFENQGLSQLANPVYPFSGEGLYTVSLVVIGEGGCKDSITKVDYITTNPSPVADFNYTRINEIDTIQFHNYSSGAVSYIWSFGDGQFSEETDPWHRYANYGEYLASLTAINEYSCTDTMVEAINFELFKGLFLPNAFSPDNISEEVREFKAIGIGLIKYHLLIFDTWGNLLWESDKLDKGVPAEGWDGTFKGEPLSPDVYVWHLKEAVFKDGSAYGGKRYGTITLIK